MIVSLFSLVLYETAAALGKLSIKTHISLGDGLKGASGCLLRTAAWELAVLAAGAFEAFETCEHLHVGFWYLSEIFKIKNTLSRFFDQDV